MGYRNAIVTLALLMSFTTATLLPVSRVSEVVTGSIFTSQLGFALGSPGLPEPKSAVLAVPTDSSVVPVFSVRDATSNAVVYSSQAGDVQAYPGGWYGSDATGDTYLLDFTRWTPTAPGRYVVESNGIRSLPFQVGTDVYDVRKVDPLEFFRIQQSGVSTIWQSLDGTIGGHGPDHLDDGRQANKRDDGGGDAKLIMQDHMTLPGGRLDVTGGWFDAGDYNKYMGNTPWAAYLLLLTYEDHTSYWSGVDKNGNGVPDLLEYVKPALDWMLKMQDGSGAVYERVFDGYGAAFDGRPELGTENVSNGAVGRPLDTDRYADITAKASYAMAAAYRVFHDERYLNMAIRAWNWAYNNQGTVKPKIYGGGLYFGDVEIGLTLGAVEIHRALLAAGQTPDQKYVDFAATHIRAHLAANDWINPSSWDYQQSYAMMRYYDLGTPFDQAATLNELKARWDAGIQYQGRNAYRMNDEWLYSSFGQNDVSASSAGDALWVYSKTGLRKYYDYAVNQMAWIFGRNPFGESWLASSQVSEYTTIPHWRATAKHPIEGVVVPGACDYSGDKKPDYTDTGDWYYSEPSINQQAMFVRVMSALNQASGGPSGPQQEHAAP